MPKQDILSVSYKTSKPKGKLLLVDTEIIGVGQSLKDEYVGLDNFGTNKRYQIWYYTAEEYDAFIREL